MPSASQEAFAEAVSAGMGGAFSSSCLYPIEICKNRLQASQKKEKQDGDAGNDKDAGRESMATVAAELYGEAGLAGFYKGFQYSALQSATEKAIYFYGYTYIVKAYTRLFGGPSVGGGVLCGCLAEWVHLPVTLPIDAVTCRMQTSRAASSNPVAIIREVLREGGVCGLYSGWAAYIVLCLKPAITYALFDYLKRLLLRRKHARAGAGGRAAAAAALTALEAFVLGAIARGVATVAVFPYTRAKVCVCVWVGGCVCGCTNICICILYIYIYIYI